jgi:hypothetical protein
MAKSELRKDMEALAKQMYELGKKHGDIYISAAHCVGSDHASVDYGSDLKSVYYWGKEKRYST